MKKTNVSEGGVCGWRRWVWMKKMRMKEMIVGEGKVCEWRRWMWKYLYR